MKIIVSKSKDPFYNLSLEETLLKDDEISEDILLLYINQNTIVFGRNQNIHEEINAKYVEENKINLVRRVSGGGAVYHDQGNLNFSFITKKEKNSYSKFLNPIIGFLKSLGLNAEFKGRNDVTIDGYKISGNAQYIFKEKMFHHGTLLFDANLTILSKALNVNKLKLESKSIKSVRKRVSNIIDLLPNKMSIEEFRNKLINYFKTSTSMDITNYKKDETKTLMNVRKSNDWLYGKNPNFNIKNEKKYDGGLVSVFLDVSKNKIQNISIYGDYLSTTDPEDINKYFIGKNFEKKEILKSINLIKNYEEMFGTITKKELANLILGE